MRSCATSPPLKALDVICSVLAVARFPSCPPWSSTESQCTNACLHINMSSCVLYNYPYYILLPYDNPCFSYDILCAHHSSLFTIFTFGMHLHPSSRPASAIESDTPPAWRWLPMPPHHQGKENERPHGKTWKNMRSLLCPWKGIMTWKCHMCMSPHDNFCDVLHLLEQRILIHRGCLQQSPEGVETKGKPC